jgi:hypothetical protein
LIAAQRPPDVDVGWAALPFIDLQVREVRLRRIFLRATFLRVLPIM